jgi:hypothetical protein
MEPELRGSGDRIDDGAPGPSALTYRFIGRSWLRIRGSLYGRLADRRARFLCRAQDAARRGRKTGA